MADVEYVKVIEASGNCVPFCRLETNHSQRFDSRLQKDLNTRICNPNLEMLRFPSLC